MQLSESLKAKARSRCHGAGRIQSSNTGAAMTKRTRSGYVKMALKKQLEKDGIESHPKLKKQSVSGIPCHVWHR